MTLKTLVDFCSGRTYVEQPTASTNLESELLMPGSFFGPQVILRTPGTAALHRIKPICSYLMMLEEVVYEWTCA